MVRFSDIINIKDMERPKGKSLGKEAEEDRLRLSNVQLLKRKEERISAEPSFRDNGHLEIVTYYEKFLERAMNVRERVNNDQGISPSPILTDLHYIINKNLIDELYEYSMSAPDDYDEIMVHTIMVTFASLKVGKGMGYDTEMLLKLGLAAFLENVGIYKIPGSILRIKGRLEEGERRLLIEHPRLSYEILALMGERYKWLAKLALQIHERADGSGYPDGMQGEEINELASIIGLIDTYVSLLKDGLDGDPLGPTDAIKFIIKNNKDLFPPKILKVFLNQISLFPVNTYVKLNSKFIGRVISTEEKQPLRPVIELLYDGPGNRMEKREIINLAENPLLYVLESIHEKDLP